MKRKNITSGVRMKSSQRTSAGGGTRTSGVVMVSQTPVATMQHRPAGAAPYAAWKWNDNDYIIWNDGDLMTYA